MKNFLVRFTAVLLAFQGVVAAQLLTPTSVQAEDDAPTVVINEVMWMGSRVSGLNRSADEWIELYNYGGRLIDLTGWILTNTGLDADTLDGQMINPNEYLLISNYKPGHANSVLSSGISSVVDSSINLPGEDSCPVGGVELKNSSGMIVDRVTCFGGSWPAGLTNANERRAMERSFPYNEELWHTSIGFANMISSANSYTFATPLIINDRTQAVGGIVNDGTAADINWSDSLDTASVNWSGFVDPESGLTDEYVVELYDSTNTIIDSAEIIGTSHTFASLNLDESGEYYFEVSAVNGVDLLSAPVRSNGFTVDTVNPEAPTNVKVTDVGGDSGGSVEVRWDQSVSLDDITYQLNYRKQGAVDWTSVPVGMQLSHQISALENAPTVYEFTVTAIDFSRRYATTAIEIGQALDNLAPILTVSRVAVGQNRPGTADTVSGVAGAVNELSTVSVFDRVPSTPGAILLGSVMTNADGSFASISIGDNRHATVHLQAVDLGGNFSPVAVLQNDIVGPNPPTLHSVTATCQSESCRVELRWVDNGPDTATYQVGYTIDGVERRTLPLDSTEIALGLPTGQAASFVVYAFDRFGNESVSSNAVSIQLTAGVKTMAIFSLGRQTTVTEAIPGSREVVTARPPEEGLQIVPPAQAAEPIAVADGVETTPPSPVQDATDRDWTRIFVVVLLLLLVAGGFYSLSRTFRDVPADEPILPVAAKKKGRPKGPKTKPAIKSKGKK